MQLDYRQFLVKLEKMTEQKPVPYQVLVEDDCLTIALRACTLKPSTFLQDYVDSYVKAYYIPEMDLEAWVSQHNKVRKVPWLFFLMPHLSADNPLTLAYHLLIFRNILPSSWFHW